MHTRIAVVGDDEALVGRLMQEAEGSEAILERVEAGEGVPGGATGVIGAGGDWGAVLAAALAVGAEQEGLLTLIGDAVGIREEIPVGSTARVRDHATRFAQALGLSPDDQLTLERGAVLRDIGKITLSNELLLKKSVLDFDEWTLLKSHSKLGGDVLRERGLCLDVLPVIEHHHECYDGDGYPGHLEGEDIPYLARILRIVDVYCAMTSPRHYRSTHASHEEAALHLTEERGKHFDPELVDVFLKAEAGQCA